MCAVKGGKKFTYANACFAAKDGAKVVSHEGLPGRESREGAQEGRQEEEAGKKK